MDQWHVGAGRQLYCVRASPMLMWHGRRPEGAGCLVHDHARGTGDTGWQAPALDVQGGGALGSKEWCADVTRDKAGRGGGGKGGGEAHLNLGASTLPTGRYLTRVYTSRRTSRYVEYMRMNVLRSNAFLQLPSRKVLRPRGGAASLTM